MNSDLQGRKILVLGAGTWQLPYILKAKELGLRVYATDWSACAPGAKHADVFEPIDLKNREATLSFARRNHVEAVFTSADIGVTTAAFVANELALIFHSNAVAFSATNKLAMRNKAWEAGLGTPKYKAVENVIDALEAAGEIGFPLIIKPVDNCSSRGVRYVSNVADLKNWFSESLSASFTGKVLLEEFMTGTEGSVEAVVDNGATIVLGVCDKVKSPLPYRYDVLLNYPGEYTNHEYGLICDFTRNLVRAFEIKSGIVHIEFIVDEDSVKLIEFAARGCGSKVVTHLIPAMTGFDVMDYLLNSSFGKRKQISITKNLSGALKFIMLEPGTIKEIGGIDEVRRMDGIVDMDVERKVGDTISEIRDGRSRPAYILAVGKDRTDVANKLSGALAKLKVTYQ